MEETAQSHHARRVRGISIAAWVTVLVAVLASGTFIAASAVSLAEAESVAQSFREASADAATAVAEAQEAYEAAQKATTDAERKKDSEWAAARAASSQLAQEFDAEVAELARTGQIARNPHTGLGLPPRQLLDELNQKMAAAHAGYQRAMQELTSAQSAEDNAKTAVSNAEAYRDATRLLATVAAREADDARGQLILTSAIAGGVVFALLIVAAGFWIASSRASADAASARE